MKDFPQPILNEYDQTVEIHTDFMNRCEALVKELLKIAEIPVHETTARLKDRKSLVGKLEKPDSQSKYSKLTDVQDIIGLRVITYFNDEVDKVGEVIQREFNIDENNSTDKRALLAPDRFGYLSKHYIASLSPSRLALAEYQRFENCVFEIQIRSILQHTWAEIQHDLGYKSKTEIPEQFQRQFAMLAGILENADEQFAQIRNGLTEHRRTILQRMDDAPQSVQIDLDSITEFVRNNSLVRQIDDAISAQAKVEIVSTTIFNMFVLPVPDTVGVRTIAQLQSALDEYKQIIPFFAESYIGSNSIRTFPGGISIFFLWYILAAKGSNGADLDHYLASRNFNAGVVQRVRPRIIEAVEYAERRVRTA